MAETSKHDPDIKRTFDFIFLLQPSLLKDTVEIGSGQT